MSSVLSYYISLRCSFRCDIHYNYRIKNYLVRLYPQLCVGVHMSYLGYLYLFAYIGVKHVLTMRVMMASVLI